MSSKHGGRANRKEAKGQTTEKLHRGNFQKGYSLYSFPDKVNLVVNDVTGCGSMWECVFSCKISFTEVVISSI